MICPNCSTENEPGRKFCGECGTRLATSCPSCGAANPPGTKFCGECGTVLSPPVEANTSQAASSADTAPAPGAQAPGATGAAAPTTERRIVSVLFVDLVGFTTVSEARDPEAVRELLARYFETAQAVIGRYGGTIEKFIGDAVMAVWGAPVSREDDAELAVRAGLDLVDAVAGLDNGPDGPRLAARAGVLTGEAAVTLGAQGQGLVAGDMVNTASRLQGAAPAGAVLVGDATRAAASRAIAFESVGDHLLKGKALPVAAWRATGVIAGLGGAGRSDALEPPFVGREAQFRLLRELFHTAAEDHRPRLVSITGIAGVGKSRLAWELEKYLDGLVENVWWHQGRSPAYGEGITFWALGEMVRRRAGILESDDPLTTAEKLGATVREHVADETDQRWIEPRLAALLGLEEAPTGDRDELFAAWRRFFEWLSQRAPVVMVFEDLHWADPGLIDFVETILEWSRSSPILVVTLARPELIERRPSWGAGLRSFTALHLEPLDAQAMRRLLGGLAPDLPAPLVERILRRAEGIPLYAVETIRMLLDSGRLVRDEGVLKPTGPIDELAIPDTLHSLVAARLDGLDAADRSLIQDASVLGQTFTLPGLAAMTGRSADDLEARLRGLVGREILVRDTDPRSPERGQYGFVQAIIREVAHSTLSRGDRRTKHLAAARHFETLQTDEVAGILASHYLEAYQASPAGPEADGLRIQARIALSAAADRAAELHSHDQAIAFLESAIAITDESDERDALEERLGRSARTAGHYDVARRRLTDLLDRQVARGDPVAAARVAAELGRTLNLLDDPPAAISVMDSVLARVAAGDVGREAVVDLRLELGRSFLIAEEVTRALDVVEPAVVDAERLGRIDLVLQGLITKGALLDTEHDRSIEAIVLLRGARSLAQLHGLVFPEIRALWNIGATMLRDDPIAALEAGSTVFDLATRVGQRDWSLASIGWTSDMNSPDWDAALARLDEFRNQDLPDDVRLDIARTRTAILALKGRFDEASVEAALAKSLLPGAKRPDARMYTLVQLGLPDLFGQRFEAAYDRFRRALEIDSWVRVLLSQWAVRSAAMLQDATRLRPIVDQLDANVLTGRWLTAVRLEAHAGLAGIEGRRDESISGFRDATRRFRELRCDIDVGWALVEMVALLGPESPEARAAADEAREMWTRRGSPPMLAILDAALSGESAAHRRHGRAPEAGRQTEALAAKGPLDS